MDLGPDQDQEPVLGAGRRGDDGDGVHRTAGSGRPGGLLAGFWMLGYSVWPMGGEIDIMEDINGLSKDSGTLHRANLTQRNSDGTARLPGWQVQTG